MAVWIFFFLCSPDCPKRPKIEFSYWKCLSRHICSLICDIYCARRTFFLQFVLSIKYHINHNENSNCKYFDREKPSQHSYYNFLAPLKSFIPSFSFFPLLKKHYVCTYCPKKIIQGIRFWMATNQKVVFSILKFGFISTHWNRWLLNMDLLYLFFYLYVHMFEFWQKKRMKQWL